MADPIDPALTAAVRTLFGPDVRISRGYKKSHDGVDIAAALGTPLHTIAQGTVSYAKDASKDKDAGHYWAIGGGNVVNINVPNNRTLQHAHLQSIAVKQGAEVAKGALIGKIGATGNATGPHVHFGLWDHGKGRMVNPLNYLQVLASLVAPAVPAKLTDVERFAAPRHFRIPPGTHLEGYDPARPNQVVKHRPFPEGSGASATAIVSISYPGLNPQPMPSGTFVHVRDGGFKGLFVPASSVVFD